jgi:biopolymer transport protein ExbB
MLLRIAKLSLPFLLFCCSAGNSQHLLAQQMPSEMQPSLTSSTPGATDAETPNARPIPNKNLLQIIRAGGIVMMPILFCSFLTLVFALERGMALRRGRVLPGPFTKRFLHQLAEGELDRDEALQLCEENRSPIAQVFGAAIRKWNRPTVEVEQAVLDQGERTVNVLRRYVRLFNGISTISPLLGLLGTVFGMIQAFNDIAATDAMGRPELLASGISEALITTAAGLCVAIPALVCYLFFVSRVDQLTIEIDALGQQVVALISNDSESARPTRSRRSRDAA